MKIWRDGSNPLTPLISWQNLVLNEIRLRCQNIPCHRSENCHVKFVAGKTACAKWDSVVVSSGVRNVTASSSVIANVVAWLQFVRVCESPNAKTDCLIRMRPYCPTAETVLSKKIVPSL